MSNRWGHLRLPEISLLCLFNAWSSIAFSQASSIELGIGYNSEDSYQQAQFTGISQSGGFTVGGFSAQNQPSREDDLYWSVTGRNLGLETGSLAASYERKGRFALELNYDQLPHYQFNDGRTPFNGSGSSQQTLPPNWIGAVSTSGFTFASSSLNEVNIDKKRERFTGGLEWQLGQSWQFMSEFRHETKEGNKTLGAIFGTNGGNPRGSIIATPIDFQTDEVTFGISYANSRTQYNLAYSAMLFSNDNKALRFDNPFNQPNWSTGANFSDGAVGQIALEPDNTSSQFSFSAAHTLGTSTRLSGSVISTRLEQDDSYLPYSSVFEASTPLPRLDLDGRVDSLVGNFNLSTRLSRKTTLRLRYNYRERDNKTPQDIYLRIPNDSSVQGGLLSSRARINRIYDLERDRFSADVTYRISSKTRLSAGYEYQETDRTMVDVATTEEGTGFIKLNFTPSSISSGWVKLTRSERDASSYESTVPFVAGHNPDYIATLVGNEIYENDPLLRRYHLTDRERDEISASLNIYPSDLIGLSLLAKKSTSDYPTAVVGLSKSEDSHYAVDVSYNPEANWTASLYYNLDQFSNQNNGYARRGSTPFFPASVRNPELNWVVKSEDKVDTFGGGIDWELLNGRLNLSIDATYTDAVTETRPNSGGASPPIPGTTTAFLFPDITTEITSFSIKSRYQLRPGRELAIRYWYEDFGSADWALDNTEVDTLSNILLMGNQSPDYSGHIFLVSFIVELE